VSKSVLLEIARQETPERQVALWEQASRGELTVQKARKARSKLSVETIEGASRRDGRERQKLPTAHRHTIQTPTATVILEFPKEPSVAEMIVALKAALISLQKK